MRTRHYLTSRCLDAPCDSAWMTLYKNGHDSNYLNATSPTRAVFQQLSRRFARFYHIPPSTRRGCTPKLRYYHQVLGLLLCFYVGAEEALSRALDGFAPARIARPSPSHQKELVDMVKAREPLLSHTFGFIDGKNLRVQQPFNADLQNAMYNGWLHSLLDPAYCPDERVNVVSDSAFPCSTAVTGRILTPLKDRDLERIPPSLRSSAGLQSTESAAPYDLKLRGLRLNNLFRMVNYRVRTVGISEIRTTFTGAMEMSL
ncbi:hypothetical protein PI125_g17111 [Phytophthora idaei]|nr:hypothetical protein PI125_g17111 [Phytophthora idaei]